jgi:hypothetical protein
VARGSTGKSGTSARTPSTLVVDPLERDHPSSWRGKTCRNLVQGTLIRKLKSSIFIVFTITIL